jgi:23S rRNA (uracil1939-C5)-methyltransferase
VRVEIKAMGLGPYGIARIDESSGGAGKIVMVPHTAPGDLAEVEIVREHRDYFIGRLRALVAPGSARRYAPCEYLPGCGGCDWQQIDYRAQVKIKGELIARELNRVLNCAIDPVGLVVPAADEFGYRSRIRLRVSPNLRLGFNQFGTNQVVEIERCLVGAAEIRIPHFLPAVLGRGCEEIEIVADRGALIAVAKLKRPPDQHAIARTRRALEARGSLKGVIVRAGKSRRKLGDVLISIEVEPGLAVELDADLFTQVNQAQNRALVSCVMERAALAEGKRVLDLFCGAGNFSLPAARRGAQVTAFDSDALAIAAALANARRLGLQQNARFSALGAKETAQFLRRAGYRAQLLILDPPRAGAVELIDPMLKLRPDRIIYVSCDVATLARDLRLLRGGGYRLNFVRAFDFFPNTHHAEVVAEAVLT